MEFIKKHKSKLQVVLIISLLVIALGIATPIVIYNIQEVQHRALRLESKANAKEAWEKELKLGTIIEGQSFEWNDGKYYWVIDYEGNITEIVINK